MTSFRSEDDFDNDQQRRYELDDLLAPAHHRNLLLHKVFRHWYYNREVAVRIKLYESCNRIADTFAQQKLQSTALDAWRWKLKNTKMYKAFADIADKLHKRHTQRRAIVALRRIVPQLRRRRLHRDRIEFLIVDERNNRTQLEEFHFLCTLRLRQRSFSTLYAYARRKAALKKTSQVAKLNLLKARFASWLAFTKKKQLQLLSVNALLSRWTQRSIRYRVFLEWLRWTGISRGRRIQRYSQALVQITNSANQRRLCISWHSWRKCARLRTLKRLSDFDILRRYWVVFTKSFIAQRATEKVREGYAAAWREYKVESRGWSQWRFIFCQNNAMRSAILKHRSSQIRSTFKQWHQRLRRQRYLAGLRLLSAATRRRLILRHTFSRLLLRSRTGFQDNHSSGCDVCFVAQHEGEWQDTVVEEKPQQLMPKNSEELGCAHPPAGQPATARKEVVIPVPSARETEEQLFAGDVTTGAELQNQWPMMKSKPRSYQLPSNDDFSTGLRPETPPISQRCGENVEVAKDHRPLPLPPMPLCLQHRVAPHHKTDLNAACPQSTNTEVEAVMEVSNRTKKDPLNHRKPLETPSSSCCQSSSSCSSAAPSKKVNDPRKKKKKSKKRDAPSQTGREVAAQTEDLNLPPTTVDSVTTPKALPPNVVVMGTLLVEAIPVVLPSVPALLPAQSLGSIPQDSGNTPPSCYRVVQPRTCSRTNSQSKRADLEQSFEVAVQQEERQPCRSPRLPLSCQQKIAALLKEHEHLYTTAAKEKDELHLLKQAIQCPSSAQTAVTEAFQHRIKLLSERQLRREHLRREIAQFSLMLAQQCQ